MGLCKCADRFTLYFQLEQLPRIDKVSPTPSNLLKFKLALALD
ncbi:6923_t:CDS:2 [Funneliformis geosporum]|nr:6923_t:CDS:2 [Funneliformis geosporum]